MRELCKPQGKTNVKTPQMKQPSVTPMRRDSGRTQSKANRKNFQISNQIDAKSLILKYNGAKIQTHSFIF